MDNNIFNNEFVCARCKEKVDLELNYCTSCQFTFIYKNKSFTYNYDELLFQEHRNKYLLNKVLNNNGYISYKFLPEGSLSLPEREDVKRFKNYLLKQFNLEKKSTILDIGCGLLEVPGYLDFKSKNMDFYGIEPLSESLFFGKLITGCSEFIPLKSSSMDYIIFATSLDHVCSIDATLKEVNRVLKEDGKVIVWMSDQSKTLFEIIKDKIRIVRDSLKKGYRTDRYYVYPDLTVLQVPIGAVDPFHSFFESPEVIKKLFIKKGFKFINMEYNSKNEVFLTFIKSLDG